MNISEKSINSVEVKPKDGYLGAIWGHFEDIFETGETTWTTYDDQDEKVSKTIGFSSIWDKHGHLVWEWGTYDSESLFFHSIWGPPPEHPEPQQQKGHLGSSWFCWSQMNIYERSSYSVEVKRGGGG